MKDSNIEWTDATWSPWKGCTKVSEGCRNCYAETMSHRNPKVLGIWGPEGKRVVTAESGWEKPLQWNRQAEKEGKRFKVFNSLCDIFEDWTGDMVDSQERRLEVDLGGNWISVPEGMAVRTPTFPLTLNDVRIRLFKLIEATPNLDWLLLTKRPENILKMLPGIMWLDSETQAIPVRENVWLGTSIENQEVANYRIPHLLRVPAKVRFLSCEPLLGPVRLDRIELRSDPLWDDANPAILNSFNNLVHHESTCRVSPEIRCATDGIGWVIVGGESGPNARPMHPDWARSLRDQCVSAGVPYFFKQWGNFAPYPQVGTDFNEKEIMEKMLWLSSDGRSTYESRKPECYKNGLIMADVGKVKAGRELDSREWNEFPKVTG